MVTLIGPPIAAIRNQPISAELRDVLMYAATQTGIEELRITSGGQDGLGEGTRRTGSTRHDHGRAADLQCRMRGAALTFTDASAPSALEAFVAAAAAAGIGAGIEYMGDRTLHIGFGLTRSDQSKLTWGVIGASATAPSWLRNSATKGWQSPVDPPDASQVFDALEPGLYTVSAEVGLNLRSGPGINYSISQILPYQSKLWIVGSFRKAPVWAFVDLNGDGLIDGCVSAQFLSPLWDLQSYETAIEP